MSELFVSRLRASEKLTASAAVSVSTAQTNAYQTYHSIVRVISDRIIHIALGTTATQSDALIAAFEPFYVSISSAEQLAFVTNTGETDGSIWVTHLDRSS